MKKIPITGFEEGNCCPECGSTKVSLFVQYSVLLEFDLKGKQIIKQGGKRVYRPSNQLLAAYYNCVSCNAMQCANYLCNKCGWESELYVP